MSLPKEETEMEVESAATETVRNATMEVYDSGKNVMASGTTGSVTCSLHPLVIMNISEHWTRERAQEGSVQQGAFFSGLFGEHNLKFFLQWLGL